MTCSCVWMAQSKSRPKSNWESLAGFQNLLFTDALYPIRRSLSYFASKNGQIFHYLGGHPHMFFIILADRPHGSCEHTFLKPVLRVEKSENAALAFRVDTGHHRPTPQPQAFDLLTLQRLIITTTTMVDYMLVFVPQKISSLLGLLGQNIFLLCHYAEWKRNLDKRLAIFFLLCLVSPSTVCLYPVRKRFWHFFSIFGTFQAPPIGWNMNYSVLSRLQWIRSDTKILETMPRKTGEKKVWWMFWYV